MTRSLGSRLSWAATFFVLMLVIAIGLVIFFGFRSSMQSGLRAGASELETQTEQAVNQIVVREAELYSQTLERVATVAHIAAEAFQTTEGFQTLELVRGAEGQWYDPNPARKSEVMVARFYDVEKTLADQRDSLSLEILLPNLLAQIPNGVAIYYVGTSGLLRYYPVINIEGTSSSTLDVLKHPLFTGAAPSQNPERKAVWTSPYQDDAIFGLLTTVSVPVYSGEVFRGVIGVDVSLENFSRQLEQLNISKQSYGFVMDAATNLIAAPADLITLLAWGNTSPQLGQPLRDVTQADFISVLETMTKGTAGIQHLRLKEKPYVIAYAPIRATGWQLGVVLDHAEMTKPIDNFAATFLGDALRILTLVMGIVSILFLLGLFAIRAFSHRYLTHPIKHLLQTTQAIANGELGVQAKVDSEDELGQLGHSLNAMSTKLAQAKEQEREIEQLHHSVSETKILIEIANSFHLEDDLTTTLQTIAKAVVDNTNLVDCVLTTTGEDRHPWSIRVSHGLPQAFIEASEQAIADGARMNMSAQVHQTRERVVMANWWDYIRREPSLQGLLPWAEQSLWESVVCVPLLTRTQIVGTSYFYFPPNAVLSEQVLNLFDAVANQVALTIENAFLNEQTRRAEQEARTLSEIAAVVADPEGSSLNQIAERVIELSEAVACAIYVFEVADSRLQLAGAAGLPEGYNQTLNALWQQGRRSAAVQAFEEQSVLVRERLRDDTLANPEYSELHPFLKTVTWQKAVFVPLSLGEKTLGTLVTYFHNDLTVTSTVIQFVQAIADQVVVAVENARLFLEIQNKAGLEERQKLARELHDSVSQALFSIALSARTARTLLKRGQAENALEPVEYTLSLAEAGIAEMHALIFELRPESLEQEGLKMALSKQAASVQARHQLQVKLELGDEPNLDLKTKEALYRIAQEALHNIVKHASARVVEIRLQTQNDNLILEIRDDGKGFDTLAAKPGHLGLHSMRERAQGIGASFEVESAVEQGTTIRLELPL